MFCRFFLLDANGKWCFGRFAKNLKGETECGAICRFEYGLCTKSRLWRPRSLFTRSPWLTQGGWSRPDSRLSALAHPTRLARGSSRSRSRLPAGRPPHHGREDSRGVQAMSSGSHPWTHQTLATLAILAGIGHLITRFRAAGICVYDITQTRSLKLRVCWCSGLNVFNAVDPFRHRGLHVQTHLLLDS